MGPMHASRAVVAVTLADPVFAQQILDPEFKTAVEKPAYRQTITLPDGDRQVTLKAGMNAPGNDNRLFALNVPRWLSGLLLAAPRGR
jgi:hypothetical protein